MPLNYENLREVVSLSRTYQDLRHLQDDKTVLENPHKGWYYHFVDNSLKRPPYRDRIKRGERFITQGMHHAYLRFDWGDIEAQEEGILDWSEIDDIIDERSALGYQISLRICTYESGTIAATPKWVFDKGAAYTEVVMTTADGRQLISTEPEYGDPIFLEKLEAFLAKCSKKFDRDPRIEFIDVGTFGTWGEGHTSSGSNKSFPLEVLKKHIHLHLKYFPNKTIIINDDYFHHLWQRNPEEASELFDYCVHKGLGIRDDSICVQSYVNQFGYDTMRIPSLFAVFAENAPVDIEFAHIFHNIEERFKGGYPIIEALRTAHATFAGFHGYEDEWHAKSPYLSDYLANRLGYWFFIDGIDLGSPCSGSTEMAEIRICNKGFSKCYHQYDLKLRLSDSAGNLYSLNSTYPDSTKWREDSLSTEVLRLDYRKVPAGEYHIELGLFEADTPIKLGFKADMLLSDGYYRLGILQVNSL